MAWPEEEQAIRLAVMDMWKPFRKVKEATGAAGSHPIRQVPCHAPSGRGAGQSAQDRICPADGHETGASSRDRSTRCWRIRRTSTPDGGKPEGLLAANKRLNTAYILKETFGQLWDYQREGWARRFFENWRDVAEVATTEAIREVRRDDRATTGMGSQPTANRRTKSLWDLLRA